jgi:hypothetical protein
VIGATSIDWTQVITALIVGLPAIIAAILAGRVHRQVKTPSGKPIGAQVEDTLHTSLSNNYHLQSLGAKMDAPTTTQASGEAGKVDALNGHADEPGS